MESMSDPNFEEPSELELPKNHPGISDPEYIRRRKMFYLLARDLRLRNLGLARVPYTLEEQVLWTRINSTLKPLHERYAAQIFWEGVEMLKMEAFKIPQLADLDEILGRTTGFRVIPAEGLLAGKSYFEHWANGEMPCTQFLRHPAQPGYTPEPDMVHDVLGHVPPLTNEKYCKLIKLVGALAKKSNLAQIEKLIRFYWFTIEFGLIEEEGKLKILGAGILSSSIEIEYALSSKVKRSSFDVAKIINTQFNPNIMQEQLFVLNSLNEVEEGLREVERLLW